jgi:hypothetical protein
MPVIKSAAPIRNRPLTPKGIGVMVKFNIRTIKEIGRTDESDSLILSISFLFNRKPPLNVGEQ